ncbi:hypothetical protein [Hydrogenimonas cancrithermarum]|uniref:Lipoprotein n=1 Tax=Hydrogenimonas cancrithermarum TaxID=2993563 RepID=A0ABM8FPB5_9BACT|nr:hypothetical protein [Hydrogenimonas cancrithermarum]BDY13771.1 hypothetical protein HCR_20830 [Hydrogenimonas cancrithermarum]
MKYILILSILLSIQGCVYFNDDGISSKRYRDCIEYYDAEGLYHCECDENLVDYKDIPNKLLKGQE